MKIFVLIPVHNRAPLTTQCVHDLLAQSFSGELEIVIINDGSTDGTEDQLVAIQESCRELQSRTVTVINGTGDWWWTKCIDIALAYIRPNLKPSDSVLLLNDDVRLRPDYLDQLIKAREIVGECIVMSQLVNIENDEDFVLSPVSVNSKNLSISADEGMEFIGSRLVKSDTAPGRGTLYPAGPLMEGHTVKSKQLPHYVADYEFSVRISRLGYPIVCALNALVFTELNWGNTRDNGNLYRRLFAKESSDNFVAHWTFWRTWSPELSRSSLLLKMVRYKVVPSVFKINRLKK